MRDCGRFVACRAARVLSVAMRSDALFPTTQVTWITLQLEALGRGDEAAAERALRDLRDHVMRRYYEPLAAYLSATGYRDVDVMPYLKQAR